MPKPQLLTITLHNPTPTHTPPSPPKQNEPCSLNGQSEVWRCLLCCFIGNVLSDPAYKLLHTLQRTSNPLHPSQNFKSTSFVPFLWHCTVQTLPALPQVPVSLTSLISWKSVWFNWVFSTQYRAWHRAGTQKIADEIKAPRTLVPRGLGDKIWSGGGFVCGSLPNCTQKKKKCKVCSAWKQL